MKTLNLYNRNFMAILSYVTRIRQADNDCIASKIAKKLGLSIGSVFETLKILEEMGIIRGKKIGRATVYEPVKSHPAIKPFHIFDNILRLNELTNTLKQHTRKIILFGSCATGEDTLESDIDLFIVADKDEQTTVRRIISEFQSDREIKPVIMDTVEFMEMQQTDKTFYYEVTKGIELWGGKDELN